MISTSQSPKYNYEKPPIVNMIYTKQEIVDILREAGIPEKDIPIMVAIALAESEGNSEAVGDSNLVNNKWDESIGLFQIRSLKDPNAYTKADKLRVKDKLFDPVYNAKVAYEISKKGKDWTDWTTFTSGKYKGYLEVGPSRSGVRNKIKIAGNARGRSKPIMAEDQAMTTEDKSLFETAVSGMPGYISSEGLKLDEKIKDARRKLNRLKADFEILGSTVTQEEIDLQQKELDDLTKQAAKVKEKSTKARKEQQTAATRESNLSDVTKQIGILETELKRTTETGKLPAVPGQRGPSSRATKSYVADLESKIQKLKDQRQSLLNNVEAQAVATEVETKEPEVPVPGSGGTTEKDTTTPVGQMTSMVQQGDGTTVYLGLEQAPIAGLAGKTTARQSTPIATEAALGYLSVIGPEGRKIKDRVRQILIGNGIKNPTDADISTYWTAAVKNTAAANTVDPTQSVWDTLAYIAKGKIGGDGTGPSSKDIKNKRETVRLLATELGVELSEEQINDLGYQFAAGNFDATSIRPRIAKIGNINFSLGEAAKTIDALKTTAAEYGVSYSQDWFNQSAKDVLLGNVDNDSLTQAIKDLAKSRYPTLAKQIDAGYSVRQIASPYIQTMGNVLEINPNDITLDDPTIKRAFTSLDAEGQPMTKPLWEFEKELRQDERWRFTKNAQQDLMGTARKVLQDFGLVY